MKRSEILAMMRAIEDRSCCSLLPTPWRVEWEAIRDYIAASVDDTDGCVCQGRCFYEPACRETDR